MEKGKKRSDQRELELLTKKIIGYCIEVHKELGPGFIESIYHKALEIKFTENKVNFESEKEVPVHYHQQRIGTHRLDFLIEKEVVLELKAVEEIHKRYYAQVRSYLKAAGKKTGLLVNFADFTLDIRRVERGKGTKVNTF